MVISLESQVKASWSWNRDDFNFNHTAYPVYTVSSGGEIWSGQWGVAPWAVDHDEVSNTINCVLWQDDLKLGRRSDKKKIL